MGKLQARSTRAFGRIRPRKEWSKTGGRWQLTMALLGNSMLRQRHEACSIRHPDMRANRHGEMSPR